MFLFCQGASYTLPDGSLQNTSGVYVSHLPNAAGCDSVITTTLNVTNTLSSSATVYICPGSSHTLPDGVVQNAPGIYTSTIPSSSGCDSVITTTINYSSGLNITANANQPLCFGEKGNVALNVSGGQAPYSFGGGATSNLNPGTYTYYVTDNTGCTDTVNATIISPPSALIISATPTQIQCYGMRGSVALNATGGTTPYTFSGDSTNNLIAGVYHYSVMDNNGFPVCNCRNNKHITFTNCRIYREI